MAYVSKEKKAKVKTALDAAINELGLEGKLKYSLRVRNHSEICMTILSGTIDFMAAYNVIAKKRREVGEYPSDHTFTHYCVNQFHIKNTYKDYPRIAEVFTKIQKAMDTDNFNNSDSQSDYFHVGHYTDISVGKYDKSYVYTGE